MKKLPVFFKSPLPLIAVIFLLASCNGGNEKENDVLAGGKLPAIDSVFDDASKKIRTYEAGESVFYTMRLESAEVASLLADSSFSEIVFSQHVSSLRNPVAFKLRGFALTSSKSPAGYPDVKLQTESSLLPRVFADSSAVFGNLTLTRGDLLDLTTDNKGVPVAYTHIVFFPKMADGTVQYHMQAYSGVSALTTPKLGGGCCGHPSPPAWSKSCVCPPGSTIPSR